MIKILLADDSAPILAQASLSLMEAGFSVTSTNNGAHVLAVLASNEKPDLLILDLNMPGRAGRQVLASVIEATPPIILISGDLIHPRDVRHRAVVGVLTKPFDQTALLGAVSRALKIKLPAAREVSREMIQDAGF